VIFEGAFFHIHNSSLCSRSMDLLGAYFVAVPKHLASANAEVKLRPAKKKQVEIRPPS
jgi:hypothetical protein